MTGLPFALDGGDVLEPEPRVRLEVGTVFGVREAAEALLTVAWLTDEGSLEHAVDEDLARMLSEPATLLVDHEATIVGGAEAVRTFVLDAGSPPNAREQWRLMAAGRRWTVTVVTMLADQPVWGPRLAEIASTFRAT